MLGARVLLMLSAYFCKSTVSIVLLPARGVKVLEACILVLFAHANAPELACAQCRHVQGVLGGAG